MMRIINDIFMALLFLVLLGVMIPVLLFMLPVWLVRHILEKRAAAQYLRELKEEKLLLIYLSRNRTLEQIEGLARNTHLAEIPVNIF